MIRSMTGFGDASVQSDGAHYAIEVRALNNRYFKAQVRLPEELQGIEADLESALAKRINRGSVVITVRFVDTSAEPEARYERLLGAIATLPEVDGIYLLPEVREEIERHRAGRM